MPEKFECEINNEPFSIVIEGKRFSILHHPELINEEMILENDYIFHGHTHRFRLDKINDCIIFNPGECAGFMKGKNQVGILDLEKKRPQIINF